MTTTPNRPATPNDTAGAAPKAASASHQASGSDELPKKKKKKKYGGAALKAGQRGEVTLTKSVHRIARAVEEGIGTWRSRRNDSARKKRNGAIRDALKNSGKAVTEFTKVASKLPEELTKGLSKTLPRLRLFR